MFPVILSESWTIKLVIFGCSELVTQLNTEVFFFAPRQNHLKNNCVLDAN